MQITGGREFCERLVIFVRKYGLIKNVGMYQKEMRQLVCKLMSGPDYKQVRVPK